WRWKRRRWCSSGRAPRAKAELEGIGAATAPGGMLPTRAWAARPVPNEVVAAAAPPGARGACNRTRRTPAMPITPKSFRYALNENTAVATITLNRPERLNALTFEV